jgi:hypothetical protein
LTSVDLTPCSLFVHDEGLPATDNDLSWTSLSRIERNAIPPSEVEKLGLSSIEHLRPVAPADAPVESRPGQVEED